MSSIGSKELRKIKQLHKEARTTMSQHTPGPWTLEGSSIKATLSNGENVQVTGMFPTHFTGQSLTPEARHFMSQEAANARLIAAAPELLEAAQSALDALEEAGMETPVTDALRDAITHAEGAA